MFLDIVLGAQGILIDRGFSSVCLLASSSVLRMSGEEGGLGGLGPPLCCFRVTRGLVVL